jgi:hypothetical protein
MAFAIDRECNHGVLLVDDVCGCREVITVRQGLRIIKADDRIVRSPQNTPNSR